MLSEKARITGMILQAYGICHRQVWFLTHSIFADQENELLSLGRIIDENSYAREKHQVKFGGNKFDFMQNKDGVLIVSEIKRAAVRRNPRYYNLRIISTNLKRRESRLPAYYYIQPKRRGRKLF